MSISPPSDIVLDVAKAADPQKYRAAADRLASAGVSLAALPEPTGASAASPAQTVKADAAVSPKSGRNEDGARFAFPASAPQTAERQRAEKAYGQFEAYFLQTFIEAMLPKDAEAMFGKGPAGAIWKSMLAEQLAGQLAETHSIGIAEAIAEKRKRIEDAKASPQPAAAVRATGDSITRDDAFAAALRKLLAIEGEQATAIGEAVKSPAKNGPLV